MALNIKDPETEALAAELAKLTGDSKTGAVRAALRARRTELRRRGVDRDPDEDLLRVLREEIWPALRVDPPEPPMTKAEREEILGIGPEGY